MTRFFKASWLPPALALAGLLVMIKAGHIARRLPLGHDETAYAILGMAGLELWLGMIVCRWRTGRPASGFLIALALFIVSIYPFSASQITASMTFILGVAGFGLWITSLRYWKQLHPQLARLVVWLRAVNGALPTWRFLWMLYTLFLVTAVSLGWYCFSFQPSMVDTVAQLVHGKIISQGHFSLVSHPLKQFFPIWMTVNDGNRFYSQYQPMHIFMLALGQLINAPWLVNPLEGALTLLLIYRLTWRIADAQTARLAAMLTLGCQFILFMSAEFMNHATSLLFVTLFILAYVETLEACKGNSKNRIHGWALLAGLGLGAVILTRPLTALGIGLPFIIYAFYVTRRAPRRYFWPFFAMATGIGLCLAFQGWYNYEITGDALGFPYVKYQHSVLKSFGYYDTNKRTITDTLLEAHRICALLNQVMFEWPIPSTLFVLLACLRPLKNIHQRLLLATLVSLPLTNMLNHWNSYVFGPRYIYETALALVIFTAIGIRHCEAMVADRLTPSVASGMVTMLVLSLFSVTAFTRLPVNIHNYSHRYFENNPVFYFTLLAQAKAPALVFIEQVPQDKNTFNGSTDEKYHWVAQANPPDEDAPVIFALDRGKENRQLIDYYPQRHAYIERYGHLYPIDKTTYRADAPPAPSP